MGVKEFRVYLHLVFLRSHIAAMKHFMNCPLACALTADRDPRALIYVWIKLN